MPKATQSAAKNRKRVEVHHGNKKRTKEPFIAAQEKFYGKVDREYNYRDLAVDDPLRVHIERMVGDRK